MADGADVSARSCVKAVTAFIGKGEALLELAEKECREGRRHFTEMDEQTINDLRRRRVLQPVISGRDVSRGSRRPVSQRAGRMKPNTHSHILTSFTSSRPGSLQDFIRQKICIERKQSLLGLIDAAAELYRRSRAVHRQPVEALRHLTAADVQKQANRFYSVFSFFTSQFVCEAERGCRGAVEPKQPVREQKINQKQITWW